jgi:hypothetical protein
LKLNTDNNTVKSENVSTVRKLINKFDNGMHGSGPKTQARKPSLTEIGIQTLKSGKISKKISWCKIKSGLFGWKTVGGNSPAKHRILTNISKNSINVTSTESTPSRVIIHKLEAEPISVLNPLCQKENDASRNGKLIAIFERLTEG